MRFLALLLFVPLFAFNQTKYQKDFENFWTDFNNNYAYFDKQKIEELWSPLAKTWFKEGVDDPNIFCKST